MFIQTEATPNPEVLKFLPGRVVMGGGTRDFRDAEAGKASPLAAELFGLEGVELSVADDGPGIEREHQGRVFERFYRADTSGKIPGTGLGMSIVKEIIDLHHGRIEVRSQPGAGTHVHLMLPMLRGA